MTVSKMLAMKRIMKLRQESEVVRSGTERGKMNVKTTKSKGQKPKNPSKSKSVKVKASG